MESCLHIGAKVDKASAQNMAEAICEVFREGHKHHQDQSTIQLAINSLTSVLEVKNVTVSNSNFVGEKTVVVEADS